MERQAKFSTSSKFTWVVSYHVPVPTCSVGVLYIVRRIPRILYIVGEPGTLYQIFVNLAPGDPERDIIHVYMAEFFRYLLNKRLDGC